MICKATKSKSQNIALELNQAIEEQKLAPGSPIMSVRDICKEFDVSSMTANKALNILVEKGVLYRKQGSGTFVSENRRSKSQFNIGYCDSLEGLNNPGRTVFGHFPRKALEMLNKSSAKVKIITYPELLNEETALEAFEGLDGLLVSNGFIDDQTIGVLEKFPGPVVVARNEKFIEHYPFHQVIPDYDCALKEVFKHIDDSKINEYSIVFPKHLNGFARRDVFSRQAERHGISMDKIKLYPIECWNENSSLAGAKIGREILTENKGKFIYSASDFISMGILEAARELGLTPGGDFDLVSVDDAEKDMGIEPVMTTVHKPRREIAVHAVKLLISCLKQPDTSLQLIRVPAHLVIRKSGLCNKQC